ncbi:MobV family relaxase [Staphylococcus arlettae]|nr:MobV family relaxase [Staphylococcus shinii]MBO3066607.1 plasmid recombination protein [Staphylococcus shinii]
MSYSIVRVSKVKSGTNTTGIQKHVQRENNNYENEDIDHSKTYLNYDLVNDNKQNFNNLIEEKIEQNYTNKRKIRTDAVKHIDGLITSDNEFFNNQTSEDTKRFFEQAKQFLEQEYGKDNLLYATVHMDEKTPHMHYGVVPITDDGRLSAKEVVGNKKALTEFQDRFNEYVKQRGYDLERGQSRQVTNAKHEQMSQYKQKTEYHKQEYERESQKTDHIKQKNDKLIQEYQKSLNTLKKPINVPYEQETEKVGGLFSKEIQETGNVVISQEDFNEFQKQIKAAQDISEDYQFVKSGQVLKNAEQKYRDLDDELTESKIENENLVNEFNDLAQRYNQLLDENQKKDKELSDSFRLFQSVFKIIKNVVKEDVYHRLIDHIDNRLESPKMREVMTVDNNDDLFFKKKHKVQEPEIIFENDRDDGFTL